MFQCIRISIRKPDGTITTRDALAPAFMTEEEFKHIQDKPLGEVLTDIRIFPPENPVDYVEDHPEMKDLMEGIKDLAAQIKDDDPVNR